MSARLHVVDDDPDHLASLCDLLGAAGHEAVPFTGAAPAIEAALEAPPALILSDLRMPGLDGIGLIGALKEQGVDLPVILLTGHGDVEHAVRAMRAGAEDFLEKPYDAEHLLSVVERTLKTGRLKAEVARLQRRLEPEEDLIGESRAMDEVRRRLSELAAVDIDVVLVGETGTGKELAARILHRRGPRRTGRFVAVNCASLPETGADEALFGPPPGAGGFVGEARGGTLYLDHIETLSPALQPKLLRVLESRRDDAEGGFRVVASSSRPLVEAIREGAFREDLYYRIAGYVLPLPPLREIATDIPALFAHFLSAAAARFGREAPEPDFRARRALQAHHWPGNAHELRLAADRYILGLAGQEAGTGAARAGGEQTLRDLVADFESREIARVLDRCGGNTDRAARILGLPRRTLNDKIARSPLLRNGRK
ncbi:sigma-54-dependent transcriptional regulator [Pseudoroseicyclus tamaricis]|uniref:Sigma-54-dependent Fis family transcriptional regulator n=1 Tax=Pseudoroseicyclus tamaricis TaxID=2705421 RepID=A0A6B2JSA6_9RHOB|nr:sigma-54 dependent transcriptional regulator [Pseudoroseicyclus tamaricis]NDV01108.1 sigma-54-dependent Fis family transcriptional regulator [Pseudoroseicyclus tamaricis]